VGDFAVFGKMRPKVTGQGHVTTRPNKAKKAEANALMPCCQILSRF